jgi:hypothetical protein
MNKPHATRSGARSGRLQQRREQAIASNTCSARWTEVTHFPGNPTNSELEHMYRNGISGCGVVINTQCTAAHAEPERETRGTISSFAVTLPDRGCRPKSEWRNIARSHKNFVIGYQFFKLHLYTEQCIAKGIPKSLHV